MPRVCPVCHRESPVESDFCPACGAPMDEHVLEGRKKAEARALDNPPMKWYKFLIYFILPLNIVTGIVQSVSSWQNLRAYDPGIYRPELRDLVLLVMRMEVGMEAITVALAAAAFWLLRKMKWRGAVIVITLYGLQTAYTALMLALASKAGMAISWDVLSTLLISAVIFVLNLIYFNKRRRLFQ